MPSQRNTPCHCYPISGGRSSSRSIFPLMVPYGMHHSQPFQLRTFPTLSPKSSNRVHHVREYGLKEPPRITEKIEEPAQLVNLWKKTTLWKLRHHQNPRPCQYSSCLTLKPVTSTATCLRPDQKTRFSRRLFNGGGNTAPMHPSVSIIQA
jgi:hypothetical protein